MNTDLSNTSISKSLISVLCIQYPFTWQQFISKKETDSLIENKVLVIRSVITYRSPLACTLNPISSEQELSLRVVWCNKKM